MKFKLNSLILNVILEVTSRMQKYSLNVTRSETFGE